MNTIVIIGGQDEIFEELHLEHCQILAVNIPYFIGDALRNTAKQIIVIDTFNDEAVLNALIELSNTYSIDAVFSYSELGVLPASFATKTLNLPGIEHDIARSCRNKSTLRERLAHTDFALPFSACVTESDVHNALTEMALPIVVKDPMGAGSANVKICSTDEEVTQFSSRLFKQGFEQVLLEKYCTGIEYSVETLTLNGQHHVLGITDKALIEGTVVESHHVFPTALSLAEQDEVSSYVVALLDAINHRHGPMHIEVKKDGHQLGLIEINNRCGGDYIWEMVSKVTGVNMYRASILAHFNGETDCHRWADAPQYHTMCYLSLFGHITPSQLRDRLPASVDIVRAEWPEKTSLSNDIGDSTQRPGFVLLGSKDGEVHMASLVADIQGTISSFV
ncbi:ATP-grasp domain-containing protein [Vibrio sp. Isolate23]|uniref:ATP-grasp domain-containing protein n=1 Tax=Vibrio sp. Isolate23 TaxID=2908533 RepID=UPI001EFCE0D3|nr:ATP-grasp domain-containing protein [Vibrio sp. Isolate23]MCG9681832.1 ATP-grasp domain-containing protein [Vibrio sp. Isolate23]